MQFRPLMLEISTHTKNYTAPVAIDSMFPRLDKQCVFFVISRFAKVHSLKNQKWNGRTVNVGKLVDATTNNARYEVVDVEDSRRCARIKGVHLMMMNPPCEEEQHFISYIAHRIGDLEPTDIHQYQDEPSLDRDRMACELSSMENVVEEYKEGVVETTNVTCYTIKINFRTMQAACFLRIGEIHTHEFTVLPSPRNVEAVLGSAMLVGALDLRSAGWRPHHLLFEFDHKDIDKCDICNICMAPLRERAQVELGCGHKVHIGCVSEWVSTGLDTQSFGNLTCPTCRQPILSAMGFPVGDSIIAGLASEFSLCLALTKTVISTNKEVTTGTNDIVLVPELPDKVGGVVVDTVCVGGPGPCFHSILCRRRLEKVLYPKATYVTRCPRGLQHGKSFPNTLVTSSTPRSVISLFSRYFCLLFISIKFVRMQDRHH